MPKSQILNYNGIDQSSYINYWVGLKPYNYKLHFNYAGKWKHSTIFDHFRIFVIRCRLSIVLRYLHWIIFVHKLWYQLLSERNLQHLSAWSNFWRSQCWDNFSYHIWGAYCPCTHEHLCLEKLLRHIPWKRILKGIINNRQYE